MAVLNNCSESHGPPVPVAKLLGVASCKETCPTCDPSGFGFHQKSPVPKKAGFGKRNEDPTAVVFEDFLFDPWPFDGDFIVWCHDSRL